MARRHSTLVRLASALALSVGLALASCGRGGDDPFVGRAPPSIDSTTGTWFGTSGSLSWKGLLGQVVYVQFGFLR